MVLKAVVNLSEFKDQFKDEDIYIQFKDDSILLKEMLDYEGQEIDIRDQESTLPKFRNRIKWDIYDYSSTIREKNKPADAFCWKKEWLTLI